MRGIPLPADSRRYAEQAFLAKEQWHRRQAGMSFTRKVQAMDQLWEMAKELPRVESEKPRSP